uniref:F-box domain-containing protein n=1 Tax=Oryza barthii TaxID=65489 RepID=A0A0D3FFL3_9ORYZ
MATFARADTMDDHDDPADDLDRISALPDDLLHIILSNLNNATTVTRTAVLSRRWRRVWTNAQALYFADMNPKRRRAIKPGQFGSFVDWAFAERGDADIQSLTIHMSYRKSATQDQINDWLRYAMRRAVKAFRFYYFSNARDGQDLQLLPIVELPSHARTASIVLFLGSSRLRLPASPAACYEALTELNLRWVSFDEEEGASAGGRTLDDFLSTCCPRLRKLEMSSLKLLSRLVLRTESLEELRISYANDLQSLDVTAPNLRVFTHTFCWYGLTLDDFNARSVIKIVAPRLEEIAMDNQVFMNTPDLHIHGLTSVRRLCDLNLTVHGQYCSNRGYGLWLLKNCPNVKHVDLLLKSSVFTTDEELADLTDESAPRLHKVRSMVLKTSKLPHHHFTASVRSFLLMCPGLRSLCINITERGKGAWWGVDGGTRLWVPDPMSIAAVGSEVRCGASIDGWRGLGPALMAAATSCGVQGFEVACSLRDPAPASTAVASIGISLFKDRDTLANHPKLTLELLQEVTITGFTRTDEEIDLVSLLFGSSSSIMSVTIHATEKEDTEKVSLKNIMVENDDNDDDTTTHQQLLEIPFTDHGCWRFQGDVYSWKRYTTEDALSCPCRLSAPRRRRIEPATACYRRANMRLLSCIEPAVA